MNVGIIGLGKLGFPMAVCMANAKKQGMGAAEPPEKVFGYDHDPNCMRYLTEKYPHMERDRFNSCDFSVEIEEARAKLELKSSIQEVVESSDIIFVAVQTPHGPAFEGTMPVPDYCMDFDYTHLAMALIEIGRFVKPEQTVAIISTVLPGTIRRVAACLMPKCELVYNPHFIAMGTVVYDFFHPDIILLGSDSDKALTTMRNFYRAVIPFKDYREPLEMSIESAELAKVAYNTYISQKIVFANTVMEICHRTPGANCDHVMDAITRSGKRLMSAKYLRGGMGDGGGCHPRDNIAMSWFARAHRISANIFQESMQNRDKQTAWLADLIGNAAFSLDQNTPYRGLPIAILGKSFKPETNITTGSPAILLANILTERMIEFEQIDPVVDYPGVATDEWLLMPRHAAFSKPHIYFIATAHKVFDQIDYPKGSLIIDPHRYIRQREGVKIIQVGISPQEGVTY